MTDKQIIIDYENLCENYSKEVGCYNTFDGSCIKEQCFTYRLLQLLKAKEQECEELKKQHESDKGLITSTGKQNYQLIQEYDKLKKCLTDIEEIAMCIMDDDLQESSAYYDAKQILQKINEVENEKKENCN